MIRRAAARHHYTLLRALDPEPLPLPTPDSNGEPPPVPLPGEPDVPNGYHGVAIPTVYAGHVARAIQIGNQLVAGQVIRGDTP